MAHKNKNSEPRVAIIMGSKSDKDTIQSLLDTLGELKITHTIKIFSAYHSTNALLDFISLSNSDVFIAAADMSVALAGIIASETPKPVIGLPLSGKEPNTEASLLSTLHMPPGIPVLTVGVDAGKDAAIAAARILAIADYKLFISLYDMLAKQRECTLDDNCNIASILRKNDYTM